MGEDDEDDEGENLLHDFELHKGEGSPVADEAHAIGGDLEGVFRQGNHPREEDDPVERPVAAVPCLLQFKMTVPSRGALKNEA